MSTGLIVRPPDLYCITDPALSGLPHEEQVRRMIEGGARLIQLRDKKTPTAELRRSAEACLALCREAGVLFILNDRVELAAEIGAPGVHIGQGDLAPAAARTTLGDDAVLGLSTHNREQFLRALDEPVDYIAVGPVFGTTTKVNPDPATGLELVEYASRLLEGDHRPLVLIGGITAAHVPGLQLVAPRALLAVVGAIVRGGDSITRSVRDFRALLGHGAAVS